MTSGKRSDFGWNDEHKSVSDDAETEGSGHGATRDPDEDERRQRGEQARRDSRRPPRALRIAAAVGLGVALVSVAALGVAVLIGGLAPGGVDVPQGEVVVEYDAQNETAQVAHDGGEAFTEENSGALYVAVDERFRRNVSLPFEEGDALAVDNVSAGQTVAVVWVAPDGDERTVASRVVGDAAGGRLGHAGVSAVTAGSRAFSD